MIRRTTDLSPAARDGFDAILDVRSPAEFSGEILAPPGGDPVQFIDTRDLSQWVVRMAEQGDTGIYNATGPNSPQSMGELLASCTDSSGVRKVIATSTGPKISTCAIMLEGDTSVKSVGG